jgi:hypothetical protein
MDIVRYHCGGWSEEVNSCILIISYMVYLYTGNYYLHTYDWQSFWHLHTIIMHTFGLYTLALSPCFFSPCWFPFCSLYLLGTLLAAIGSVHPGARLLVNWSPHFHPSPSALHLFPICFPFRNPDPLWFSQVNAPFTKKTSQLWFPRPAQIW